MVPFNLFFDFGHGHEAGTAEQLEQSTDTAGFIRYQVATSERRSIICVNTEEEPTLPLTPQDAENYYEATHYPEHSSGFSEDDVFTPGEVDIIASAIRDYNNSRRLKFDQVHFDF